MIKIYYAENIPQAHLVSNLLTDNGILNEIINENLVSAYGEIPPNMLDNTPTVCLIDDTQYKKAVNILSEKVWGYKQPRQYKSHIDLAFIYILLNPKILLIVVAIISIIVLLLFNI